MTRSERHNLRNALLFLSPWIVGFAVFMLYPIISSVYFSFCDYSVLEPAVWIGTENYRDLARDDIFWTSLFNTGYYALASLPLGMLVALALAILLNCKVRGLAFYRTIFFLPSILPVVAMSILWLWIFNGQYGVLNYALTPAFGGLRAITPGVVPVAVAVLTVGSFLWFARLSGFGVPRLRILASAARLIVAAAALAAIVLMIPRLVRFAMEPFLRWGVAPPPGFRLTAAILFFVTAGLAFAAHVIGMIGISAAAFLGLSKAFGPQNLRRLRSALSMAVVLMLTGLWLGLLHAVYGLPRLAACLAGLVPGNPPTWLDSPQWAMPALIIMGLWGVGYSVVIYLAGLQDIPVSLYESADIDGANWWQKTLHITLPMLSPVIYFNLVMGIIGTFQIFAQPYIMTQGGPQRATTFYTLYLYNLAFEDLRMGYASAMAWILFIIILVLTLLATKLSQRHVHYER